MAVAPVIGWAHRPTGPVPFLVAKLLSPTRKRRSRRVRQVMTMGKSSSVAIGSFPEPPTGPAKAQLFRAFAGAHRVLPRYLRGICIHRHCCQWLQRSEVADCTDTAFKRGNSYGEQQGPFTY